MDGINLIQDLAVVLLAAGLAGLLCKRIGFSIVVGYLMAGVVIGPYTPPFSFLSDVGRIETLSQIGLVFLMFAIGLGLSLTKLGRMGLPTLLATGLGAFFVMNLTQLLGLATGWSTLQAMFVASMFMVSSSAVIAKIVDEMKLNHDGAAQRALTITVMEDVVAVVMLTVLASRAGGGGGEADIGGLLATMSAFVVLLVGTGLLFVPRLFRRLEARADPELQTIIVAGVLFMLALAAAKAGYSLALGAFLLGAIVAEIPQKSAVEKAFAGMRDLFSSVFFVSIGMMIDMSLLLQVWDWTLGLFLFVMVARPVACGLAMIVTGASPREARRASLLLTPLGEFSFIIAQLGVSSAVLPPQFYPMAVGVSILTVLATPLVNRYAGVILKFADRVEPKWITRALEAYSAWLGQVGGRKEGAVLWKFARGRLIQIAVEVLLVTGVLIFSPRLLAAVEFLIQVDWLDNTVLNYSFWGLVGLVVLVLVFAIWRNIVAVTMLIAEGVGIGSGLPGRVIEQGLRAVSILMLGYWLYLLLPVESLPPWGWLGIAAAATVVVAIFSNRLIYWHSSWQTSVRDVFSSESARTEWSGEIPAAGWPGSLGELNRDLESWGMRLEDFVVPDHAVYAGKDLAHLALPARFGCSVIELERNGHIITSTGPTLQVYPGDRLMLLGQEEALEAAREYLSQRQESAGAGRGTFDGLVLETEVLEAGPAIGRTLAELQIARKTGVRIVGIQRGTARILNPDGQQVLEEGDSLLVAGSLDDLGRFRQWLKRGTTAEPDPAEN